jgi:lipopolysaccharide/colanic/teichoic acid biosynthesis glycosyltransferase
MVLTTAFPGLRIEAAAEQNQPLFPLSCYNLKWRQKQLLVNVSSQRQGKALSQTAGHDHLVQCLKHSSVQLIRLDQSLGVADLLSWANACETAQKAVFLKIPTIHELPKKCSSLRWQLKRLADWVLAALLLLLMMPIMLFLAALVYLDSSGPIFFQQWRVGTRGKLFRIYKFRTMVVDAEQLHHQVMAGQTGLHKRQDDPRITSLGRWMRKFSLDELPQLINVLQGEMSLVGPRPWALYDAVRLSPEAQKRLNALPGITGAWQVSSRSHLLDLETVNHCDLAYLRNWSLWQDLKILLMTVPKVLFGFGAY